MIKRIKKNNANAVVISLLVTILVVIIVFSTSSIYINKMYSLKNIDNYYDEKIKNRLVKK